MKKWIYMTLLYSFTTVAFAKGGSGSGVPSAPCYVNGKIVKINIPVNICQSKYKGSPMKKYSFADKSSNKTNQ